MVFENTFYSLYLKRRKTKLVYNMNLSSNMLTTKRIHLHLYITYYNREQHLFRTIKTLSIIPINEKMNRYHSVDASV